VKFASKENRYSVVGLAGVVKQDSKMAPLLIRHSHVYAKNTVHQALLSKVSLKTW
jgi:hypothetical protein